MFLLGLPVAGLDQQLLGALGTGSQGGGAARGVPFSCHCPCLW